MKYSGAWYDYLYDGKGNVAAVVDGNGAFVAKYRYDEFGVLVAEDSTLDQPYRFSPVGWARPTINGDDGNRER